jgi:hypothetical protein
MLNYNAPIGTQIAHKRRAVRRLHAAVKLIKTLLKLKILTRVSAVKTSQKIKQRIDRIEEEISRIYNHGK